MRAREEWDVLVVGAGPAGASAARAAAAGRASVLLVETRRVIGLPVQCAEYVPVQLVGELEIPPQAIAQHIESMRTHLPDGRVVEKPAAGFVLERAFFDRHLALLAVRAGAALRTGCRAVSWDGDTVLLVRGREEVRVRPSVIIGADGPHSTVARWVGTGPGELILGVQASVALPARRRHTEIRFEPDFCGGYGWVFPKGDCANVGLGVNPRLVGSLVGRALQAHLETLLAGLLARVGTTEQAVLGRSAGWVPAGGPPEALRSGPILLVGDAAGLAHPITGGGIAPAIISGRMAGVAASDAVRGGDLALLDAYPANWEEHMGGPMSQALANRRYLDAGWSHDPHALSERIASTWIAFPEYGRRKPAG